MLAHVKVQFFLKARWVFKRPPRASVLVFDREGLEFLQLFLCKMNYTVLDIRGESINIFILVRAFFITLLKGKQSFEDTYKEVFIEYVQPKVVLTFIDNNYSFYRLGGQKKTYVKLFIQNGWRGEVGDIFMLFRQSVDRNNNFVDYMFVFNKFIGDEYAKYVSGKIIASGSLKNNRVSIKPRVLSRTILFISQFNCGYQIKNVVDRTPEGKAIYWDDMYTPEALFLPWLAKFAKDNNFNLQIALRTVVPSEEKEYFLSLIDTENIVFLPREGGFSSYHYIDAAQYIVAIDSTLGYEALARGHRVAMFTMRGATLQSSACNFGWPADIKSCGPFWSSMLDESEFQRVMEYITMVSDEEWQKTLERYSKLVMEYDPGNTKFLSLMQQLKVPLRDNCYEVSDV